MAAQNIYGEAVPRTSTAEPIGQLFVMGNKRSGSSLLVTLLNLHPQIFITHESDVIWILYQARYSQPTQYKCYPWDDSIGMETTLKACHHILASHSFDPLKEENIAAAFFRIQKHLMRQGHIKTCKILDRHAPEAQHPPFKTDLVWIGDKKPVQHSDPEIRAFLRKHFPHARYIHLVRDPRATVASMIQATKTWKRGVPVYWTRTPGDLLERWALHEEWVLQAKSQEPNAIHTLRLEDLCQEPVKKLTELFNFLEVDLPQIADRAYWLNAQELQRLCRTDNLRENLPLLCQSDTLLLNTLVRPAPNRKYESFTLPISPRAAQVMQAYGYSD